MEYGYIEDSVENDHYSLGFLQSDVLQPTGQWDSDLPATEIQNRNGVETMGCTNYGTLNALEMLMHHLYGGTYDFSERYTGVMTRNTHDGNSPHKVIEIIRKYSGLISEAELPFNDSVQSWEDYYSGVTITNKVHGIQWLKQYEIGHEWVLQGEHDDWQDRLMHALMYSPVGIAVQAWTLRDGLYVRTGEDTHWCVLVGYEPGSHWKVFDSYDNNVKKLAWGFNFTRAKRYTIGKRQYIDTTFIRRAAQGVIGVYA